MKNKELRAKYYNMPCVIAGCWPSDPCHIKTFATRLKDEEFNIVPMCRKHHQEQGQIGIMSFIKKYPQYERYIKKLGWEIFNGKLVNEKLL